MAIIHITKTNVEKLEQPATGRVDYFDDSLRGFGIRVSPTGKTYFTMRRVTGKLVRTKIDTADKITAEAARKQATGILADMGRGIDPNQEKRRKRQKVEKEKQQVVPLQQVLDEYLQKGKLKPRTVQAYQDLFRLYLTDWLKRPAKEITRDMVRLRHQEVATGKRQRQALQKKVNKEGTVVKAITVKPREASADSCFRSLRAVLNYAFDDEDSGTPYANPVNVLSSRKKKAWFKVDRRKTLIKNSDLPAWGKAVETLDNAIMRDFLLFLLHTGLRRNEAAKLQWGQVDFQEGCFTIPDTKNKEPHTLPLSDYLIKLLMQRKAEAWHGNPYVFPGNGKSGYLQEPKRAIETVSAITGIVFTCHDLRRTFATLAESLDLSNYTVKALLNHKQQPGDVTGGYIILNVDRLREPMQKITNAIQERIKKQHGQVIEMQAMTNK